MKQYNLALFFNNDEYNYSDFYDVFFEYQVLNVTWTSSATNLSLEQSLNIHWFFPLSLLFTICPTPMTKKKSQFPKPLTGEALLKQVKELEDLPREEKARRCGYSTPTKDGSERINMMKFMNALLDAEGIEIDSTNGNGSGRSGGGRNASYRISVQSNGNLLIGSAYTKKMDLKPGDEFEISLGRKHIHLKQVNSSEEEDDFES